MERLRAYREAGADCLFVPGVSDKDTIARLVKALNAPVNILASPGAPSLRELQEIGVARVSAGSSAMRAAMGAFQRVAKDWLALGSYESLLECTIPYAQLNEMMTRESADAASGR